MCNTSIDPATTPFQNDYHSCQYKIDSGKRLNLLFFAVLAYCVEVEVVQVLWYLEIITICKCSWSIHTLYRGNARSVSLISYVVFSFFYCNSLTTFSMTYIFFLILTYKICWQRKNWDTKNNAHKVDNGLKNGICSRINHCLR